MSFKICTNTMKRKNIRLKPRLVINEITAGMFLFSQGHKFFSFFNCLPSVMTILITFIHYLEFKWRLVFVQKNFGWSRLNLNVWRAYLRTSFLVEWVKLFHTDLQIFIQTKLPQNPWKGFLELSLLSLILSSSHRIWWVPDNRPDGQYDIFGNNWTTEEKSDFQINLTEKNHIKNMLCNFLNSKLFLSCGCLSYSLYL